MNDHKSYPPFTPIHGISLSGPSFQHLWRQGVLLLFFILPFSPFSFNILSAQATDSLLRTCPAPADYNTSRVICTYGTYDNPFRDTGIVSNIHTLQNGGLRLGPQTYDTAGFGASYTYLYHVDTSVTNALVVTCHTVNFMQATPYSTDSVPYFKVRILDNSGNLLPDSCMNLSLGYYDNRGRTNVASGRIVYSLPSTLYAFDLSAFHNQTIRLQLVAGKPHSILSRNINRCTFTCLHVDTLTVTENCSRGIAYIAPLGFDYAWSPIGQPDTIISTSRSFYPTDYQRYYCRLRSLVDTACTVTSLLSPVITYSNTMGVFSATAIDTVPGSNHSCYTRYLLDKDFTTYLYSATGSQVISHDTSVPHWWIIDGTTRPDSITRVNLAPGNHTITLRYARSEQCTTQVSQQIYIDICACSYYDSLYTPCPSVYDLGTERTLCTYGNWSGLYTEDTGLVTNRHTLNTVQSYDSYTNGQLSTIPPGESASIQLGNSRSGQWERVNFLYHIDTLQADLLILRYAAVLQDPDHTSDQQPRFTFRVLDHTGADIDPTCYSADFIANASLGWNTGINSGILWKDWTTVGVDLHPLHGQTITIELTTYDCTRGGHFGYAYFTIGCTMNQIESESCGNNFSFTVPEGFTYKWYATGDTSTILSTSRQFTTQYSGQYSCHMGFIGAPAGSNCYNTFNVNAQERHPIASISLDTLDTVGCNLLVRLNNDNHQVVTIDAQHSVYDTLPVDTSYWVIDGQTYPDTPDTFLLSRGPHTLSSVASLLNGLCADTATLATDLVFHCHCTDTLFDTIVQNQLPYPITIYNLFDTLFVDPDTLAQSATHDFTYTYTFDTLVDACDTIVYHLHICPTIFRHDTVTICQSLTPYLLTDSLYVTDSILDTFYTLADTSVGSHSEDSIVVFHVMVIATINVTDYDTLVQNDLPYTWNGITFDTTIFGTDPARNPVACDTFLVHPGQSPECDTILRLHLIVYRNYFDSALLFLCPGQIPFAINDTLAVARDTTILLHGIHGEDSTVHFIVFPLHDSDTAFCDTILEKQLPWPFLDSLFYDTVNRMPFHLVNEQGCDSTIYYTLYVFWDGDHCDTTLTYPNVVTPNGDGLNDRFVIGGLLENNCFRFNDLVIYDRTGHLVYHAHNIAKDDDWWDPADHRHPAGTYFYVFKAHGVTIHTMHQGVIEVLK